MCLLLGFLGVSRPFLLRPHTVREQPQPSLI